VTKGERACVAVCARAKKKRDASSLTEKEQRERFR